MTWLSLHISLCLMALLYLVSGQSRDGVRSQTCSAARSCSDASNSNSTGFHSCSCHPNCVFFDTCCEDYQNNPQISSHQLRLAMRIQSGDASFTCEKLLVDWILVINNCDPNSNAEIQQLCTQDNPNDQKVTSKATGLTYKNLYCGMCNYERFDDLNSWSWNLDCIKIGGSTTINGTIKRGRSLLENARGCSLNATIPVIPPDGLEVFQRFGVYLDNHNLCNRPPVRTCSLMSDISSVQNCTDGPNNFLQYFGNIYKNEFCVRCNHAVDTPVDEMFCESCEMEGCKHKGPQYNRHSNLLASFGILIQPYSTDETITCKTEQDTVCMGSLGMLNSCGYGQYLNFETSTCQNICPSHSHLENGECVFVGMETQCIGKYIDYDQFEDIKFTSSNSSVFLEGKIFVAQEEDFMKCYRCESIKVYTTDINAQSGKISIGKRLVPENFIFRDNNDSIYFCSDTHEHHEEEVITTIVCLILSIIGLILYFIAYAMFSRFRNIPGQIVMGNMICLLCSYAFFLLRLGVQPNSNGCTILAILVHYFFLAAFVFMIIYASFIIYSLELVDFDTSINKWTAVKLWLIGITAPFLVLAPALTLNFTDFSKVFNPLYGGEECFIMNENAKLLYFVAPIGLCLLIAILLYSAIIFKLIQLARETRKVRSHHREKIIVGIKLLVVLGFNWIFAVVAAIKQNHITTFIFIATCSLQGFFGFVVFICNKKTYKDLKSFNKPKRVTITNSSSSSTKLTTLEARRAKNNHEQAKNLLQKQQTSSTSE